MTARIQAYLRSLDYDFNHFDLDSFIAFIAEYRQREVHVYGLPFDDGLYGLWIAGASADWIFYNNRLHVIQQWHNILHEFAHMLLDHRKMSLEDVLPSTLKDFLGNGDLQGRMRHSGPLLGDPEQEREAEHFVYLVNKVKKDQATTSEEL